MPHFDLLIFPRKSVSFTKEVQEMDKMFKRSNWEVIPTSGLHLPLFDCSQNIHLRFSPAVIAHISLYSGWM